jgi:hypothetical protein
VITIAVGVYLAMSVTDVGKGLDGLPMLAQEHLVVLRGVKRGGLLKVLYRGRVGLR